MFQINSDLKPINSENPNILIVGAGGIGCELVKSLALTSYTRMTIIDFDTVSLSNLSRQFFYCEEDIGKSKAAALAENAKKLFPNLEIQGQYGNVLDNSFNIPYVSAFDFVFCAVDNINARKKVNLVCLYSNTLLIDCASSGRLAQTIPVIPFRTACFDCSPVTAPSGPKITCTIRSTPESYDHCAAWAFHLFNSVFSGNTESADVISVKEGSSLFSAVFIDRIESLRLKENMWTSRPPPNPLTSLQTSLLKLDNSQPNLNFDFNAVWTDEESAAIFNATCAILEPQKPLEFEKDDPIQLAFVTASANLQALAFHIEKRMSMFEAKGTVAVVEPALATTNSAISAASVWQMREMLKLPQTIKNDPSNQSIKKIRGVWLSNGKYGPKVTSVLLDRCNDHCPTCGRDFYNVSCDFSSEKLATIAHQLGIESPSIVLNGKIIYDADGNTDPTLEEAGINNGDILNVDDLDSNDLPKNIVVWNGEPQIVCVHKVTPVKPKEVTFSDYSDIDVVD